MKHKSQENAVFIAIHPATCRGGGFLAHGVLNITSAMTAVAAISKLLRSEAFAAVVAPSPYIRHIGAAISSKIIPST